MTASTAWKGSLSFALVSMPARLHTAVAPPPVVFHQFHAGCGGPVRYPKKCGRCEQPLSTRDITRGVDAPGGPVMISDEDLGSLPLPPARTIEVTHFAPLAGFDQLAFGRHYYISPGDGGERAYTLIHAALRKTRKAGVATVALFSAREQLALVWPRGPVLVLSLLAWPDQIREPELGFSPARPAPAELAAATALIEAMSGDGAGEVHGGYAAALAKLVDAKTAAAPVVPLPGPAPAPSLGAALHASLDARRAAKSA
jgi:DNA end-binding protein Ku